MNQSSFFIDSLIFLGAAVVFVPLAARLGLGAVVGYLIGGIVIGPWGLQLITNVTDILHFAELGVVLFLFLIGLELSPQRLWKMRHSIFAAGTLQILGFTILSMIICWIAGFSWQKAVVIGLSLSLSSTAIGLHTLKERNLFSTTAGQKTFAILLFQDIAIVPILALLPLLAGKGHDSTWLERTWSVLEVLAIVSALAYGGRFVTRPLFRLVAATKVRELFTAFALFLIMGAAGIMSYLEISMALGAFLAGVLLADSDYRHALEIDIDPFKGLLLGLFFMSVGTSIDFSRIVESPGFNLLLLGAVLFGKIVFHILLAKMIRVPKSQWGHFALLLGQVGEFAFVVLGAATTLKIFTPQVGGQWISLAAMTMLISPLLIAGYERYLVGYFQPATGQHPVEEITNTKPDVVIAGFGRFGQIVSRLLYANGISATVLDHEPDQIELVRKFGFQAYYGDATRLDLLSAAGVGDAKILVVAIDDVQESLALVDLIKKEFPHLKIYARARNVNHTFQMMDRKVDGVERELFEGSLSLGVGVLEGLGWRSHQAIRAANVFRRHNLEMVEEMQKIYQKEDELIARAKEGRENLKRMIDKELEIHAPAEKDWGAEN
jgi:glutathione-regulated potassium-efflux system ancillary protein KefC